MESILDKFSALFILKFRGAELIFVLDTDASCSTNGREEERV
jgi:hypothetical protein